MNDTEQDSHCGDLELEYRLSAFRMPTKVWLAIPPSLPSQDVRIKRLRPEPVQRFDVGPGTVAYFELCENEGIEAWMLISQREVKEPWAGAIAETHLASEPFIKVNSEVREKALEIIGGATDRREQAYLLFKWVRDNIRYKHPPNIWGNLPALHSRRGDCGSSSFLFVSLCRAVGIPARVVFGRLLSEKKRSSPHAWAECFIDGWLPVDCSIARNVKRMLFSASDYFGIPSDPEYYFGRLDKKRLVYSFGTGLDPHLPYPTIESTKGQKVISQDETFIWGKQLYQDRIPFLQPVYYASDDDRTTQGTLQLKTPLLWRIVDFFTARYVALFIPLLVVLGFVFPFTRILLIGAVLTMLTINSLIWKGTTQAFYLLILVGVLSLLTFLII